MAFTRQFTTGYSVGGVPATITETITSQMEANYDDDFASNATDLLIPLAFDEDALKSFFIYATAACTVKTNSSGSPQETLTLAAGDMIKWNSSSGQTKPVSDDVTALYLTATGGVAGRLTVLVNHGTA